MLPSAPTNGMAWSETDEDDFRVVCGGSWLDIPESLRSSFRDGNNPDFRNGNIGFRLAQDTP
ncbi:MAG: SUMF1/EgtB/PvdO family nonheme iron enzyme [Nitrospirales bacterium]|nr:SUMF1/EgtB/PvdO family nonheme iron enzyme [Nitrospirales bacterium]